MTPVNSKAKIFGFMLFLELSQEKISVKKCEQFYWLNKCEVTDDKCLVIVELNLTLLGKRFKLLIF